MVFLKFTVISVILDMRTMFFKGFNVPRRLEFIVKKYWIIIKHGLWHKFSLGQYVTLGGRKVYYDSKLGIAGYQSMITRHNRLLDSAGVENVKLVLDCGANVGFYSLFIAHKFSEAQITAFEPVPDVYKLLEKNTKYLGVKAENRALSDNKSHLKMEYNDNDSVTSKVSSKGKVDVEALTLDEFVKINDIKNIDLLKIDTEGYEVHVLKGASEALAMTKYLVLEVNLLEQDYTVSELMSKLYSDKYNFQLKSYRNYSGKSEGQIELMDILLENILINKKKAM